MFDDQYGTNQISSWDNKNLSTTFNSLRSIQNISSIPISPTTNYVVPFSKYNSQFRPQPTINERQLQQYQQPKYQPQTLETLQTNSTKTSESESGWFAQHMSVTRVVGLLLGLIVTGVPLAVIVTLYVQLSTSSNDTTTNAPSSTISNSIPYQCTTYTSNSDNTRVDTYYCASCYCGTNYPVWFNGTHPTTLYATAIGTVCVDVTGNICYPSYSISVVLVTNCGSFYVYYLTPFTYFYSRYSIVKYFSHPNKPIHLTYFTNIKLVVG